jgi:hypothetical protein
MNTYKLYEEKNMMKSFTAFRLWLAGYAKAQLQIIDKKTKYIVLSVLIFFFFGDTLIPLIGHLLHIKLEFIESLFEHFLESVFHVTPKQAELIVFYTALILGIVILRYLSRKCYCWCEEKCANAKDDWCAKNKSEKISSALKATLVVLVCFKILFFMFA